MTDSAFASNGPRASKPCTAHPTVQLKDLNIDTLRSFRKTWKFAATSAVKRLEYLRGFLRFCEESEWIERNPATAIKPPRVTQRPTLPFEKLKSSILVSCRSIG